MNVPKLTAALPEPLVEAHFSTLERRRKWDLRYLDVAKLVATWSKDPSTKVGCVIVTATNRIAATGFNGFPPGANDDPALYADRNYKYKHVIHAEENALDRCSDEDCAGATAYTSFAPCPSCMSRIAKRGILRVVCPPVPTAGRPREWIEFWQSNFAQTLYIADSKGVQLVTLDV